MSNQPHTLFSITKNMPHSPACSWSKARSLWPYKLNRTCLRICRVGHNQLLARWPQFTLRLGWHLQKSSLIYIYYNCNLTRWVTSNPFNKTCFILICLNYTTIFYWPLHSNLLAKQDLIQYCTFKYSKSSFSFVSTHWALSLCQDLGMNCLSWWQLFFLVEVLLSVPENQRNKCSQRRQRE